MNESFRYTLSNAYLLSILARASDILFFLGIFSFFSIEEVGLYSWAIAAGAFFGITLDLGLTQTFIRDFSKQLIGIKLAAVTSIIIRLPILLLGVTALYVWNRFWDPNSTNYWALALTCGTQTLLLAETFGQAWLKGRSRQTIANILSTLDPAGRLLVLLTLIYGLKFIGVIELLGSILLMHVGLALTTVMVVMKTQRAHPAELVVSAPVVPAVKRLLTSSLTFGAIGLITIVQNRLDWLLVSSFSSQAELANYSLANKGYEMLLLFIGVAMFTVYPWLCRPDTTRAFRVRIDIILGSIVMSGVILSLVSALYLPVVLEWIWVDKYRNAKPLLQLLMPIAAVSTLIMIQYYQLIAKGLEKHLIKVSLIATASQLAVNLLLIPRLGAVGAVAGMAALAFVNLFYYSAIVSAEHVSTVSQLQRNVGFVIVMFVIASLLWRLEISAMGGMLGLLVGGLIAGYMILIPRPAKRWLKAFLRRVSFQTT